MPSRLPLDKQGQLITAAYQCCVEIGLLSGVFNVELMMTKTGPKLLEINARMGGFYLRDWINRCYGIDLVKTAFLISSGIKPILPKPKPTCHIMGVMCVPSAHGTLFNDNVVTEKLNDLAKDYEIRYNIIEEEFDLDIAQDMEEPICNIAFVADDKDKALEGLLMVCDSLGVHNECYDVKKLTESFMV
ncbi:hypothetical protein FSP39_017138 [Pinctada imbricata]|uniref:ATP-grasp domain-containing protein n=1 Tax=Pinctada imbricata TaxID=66713 RepID=A0AA88XHJ6_PINIB|nr:hypothetical protein FSP39_017138 [Pinctada imbricata]